MRALAAKHKGECLSKRYIDSQTKLKWRCHRKHVWHAVPTSIKAGTWCIKCHAIDRMFSIEMMHAAAKKRGGKCLSKRYAGSTHPLKWQCREGHCWKARPIHVLRGSWCPKCAGKGKYNLNEMRKLAKKRGGRCISKTYGSLQDKYLWVCVDGHKFTATANNVLNGSWCKECSAYLSERLLRAAFSQLFGSEFPTIRPRWLRNVEGNRLELDGYSSKLRLAFEHNGLQHYSIFSRFGVGRMELAKRKRDDATKRRLCKLHHIRLITIPYSVRLNEYKDFIIRAATKLGIRIPKARLTMSIDYSPAYSRSRIGQIKAIARQKGWRCLSRSYIDADTRLLFRCSKGHEWLMFPYQLQRIDWCPKCQSKEKRSIKSAKAIARLRLTAKKHGGQLLSTKYVNSITPLLWECARKHRWKASPASVMCHGSWCRRCWIEHKDRDHYR